MNTLRNYDTNTFDNESNLNRSIESREIAEKHNEHPDYKMLFKQTQSLYMVLDLELRIVAASDAYLKATLTSWEDIIGRHVFEVFPDNPGDPSADSAVPKALASFKRVLQTRETDIQGLQRHDVRRPESEGGGFEVRYWNAINSPVLNPDGSLAYILHRVENVTDFVLLKQQGTDQSKLTDKLRDRLVQMEADLYIKSREVAESNLKLKRSNEKLARLYRESDANLRAFYDNNDVQMSIMELQEDDFIYTLPNARIAEGFFGKSVAEVAGKRGSDLFPDEMVATFVGIFRKCLETGRSVFLELPLTYKGKEGWFQATFSPIEDASSVHPRFSFVAVDITERKLAEVALRESEERLKLATEATGYGTFDFFPQDGKLIWSDHAKAHFGLGPDAEVDYKVFLKGLHPDDRERVNRLVAEVLKPESGGWYRAEYRTIGIEDGRERWLLATGRVFFEADKAVRLIGATLDVTQRKHAEESLRQLNETLERQVAERTELSEARAKQLQKLTVELIEAEENERQRIAGWLHDDLQQILAGARLQVQSASQKADPAPVLKNVDRLLEEAINSSRKLSHELSPPVLHQFGLLVSLEWLVRQVDELFGLKVDLEADNVTDINDKPIKILIFRAAQELLFNVVKHSGVKTASVRLSFSVYKIHLAVSDKGRGFKPEALNASTAKGGLGLASMKERFNALGGDFVIDSAPGKGSSFTLSLPVKPKQMALFAQTSDKQQRSFDKLIDSENIRVLFADDHKVMRQGLIGLVSEKPGIQVIGEASDGKEALELARELRPDLVIMDISMPRMDGIEATRLIKAEMPEVCVIGLSMFDDKEAENKIRNAGAEGYVNKSESSAELLKAIYQFSGKGKTKDLTR